MTMYAQDYDESFPPGRYYFGTDAWAWDHYIDLYAQKAGSVTYGTVSQPYLVCLSDAVARTTTVAGKRSYAIPMSAIAGADLGWKPEAYTGSFYITEGRTMAEFSTPANTILLAEAPLKGNRIGNNTDFRVNGPVNQARDTPGNKVTHSNGWNYGFADGHSRWFRPEQTVAAPGITYGSAYKNAAGYNCLGNTRPRGMWTLSDND